MKLDIAPEPPSGVAFTTPVGIAMLTLVESPELSVLASSLNPNL
jgi:hypothetical protein